VGDLGTTRHLAWHPGAAVTVVIAASGYPEAPAKGDVITIKDLPAGALPAGTEGYLLHAGTALSDGELVTAGGRVLNAVGSGADVAAARAAAYAVAECVEFRGGWYRRDIAERASARG
jgi:phosphoribosylamine--glycine ligase